MRQIRAVLAVLSCVLLFGCAKPLPADKASYAGDWQAPQMRLSIGQDGKVDYQRQDGNTSTSVNAPIKEFEGNNMVVGVGPMSTTFVISAPPHEEAGVWKMTVDGVELTKQ